MSTAPEINFLGSNLSIPSGDSTPSVTDGTDFGTVDVTAGAVGHVFSIRNTGSAALNLTGSPRVQFSGANPGDFSVNVQPLATLGVGSTTAFRIIFNPSALGARSATVTIANDDSNENPYTLAVQGWGENVITENDVKTLLDRAEAASASKDGIIAVVDRGGHILGVRVESNLPFNTADKQTLVYSIDGAVALARTAAFFGNGDPANGDGGTVGPLTSRTVRFISQSTITQREVESNPNIADVNSPLRGPGLVAPIGPGGHFPPGIAHTPPVDLFAIEHTNRDSIVHSGPDSVRGTADDIRLPSRFNVPTQYVPAGQEIDPPESYGFVSGVLPNAQSRGIATLPGGIPLYKNGYLVGGIGVFFPGPKGYASYEQGFIPGLANAGNIGVLEVQRTNAPRVLEAEWIAFAAPGGSAGGNAAVGSLAGIAPPQGYSLPFGRIDLAGITLEIYGPGSPTMGVQRLLRVGAEVGPQTTLDRLDQYVTPGPDGNPATIGDNLKHIAGKRVPWGWLVSPHASGSISAADVTRIIQQGIDEANLDRSAIRLKLPQVVPGARTRMVFAVSDLAGNVLGLYRMQDATFFSIDVAVAKARNNAYYANPLLLQNADRVQDAAPGVYSLPAGVALTSRTFRFLAEPRYPAGVDGSRPGAFSILRDVGINPITAENVGPPRKASDYDSVLAFDSFNPGRNFHNPLNIANQNGTVFFPGATPLYSGNTLIGGLGVSGDGVDQDDLVTYSASIGNAVPSALRADQYFVRNVRLPFFKFPRNPRA